jgi:16S rRNA (cytidine1402-2'-O)-methyltransferase
LLKHFAIETPLVSLHAHNEKLKVPGLVERMKRGESVALVSDAGTPGISDPGSALVRAAAAAGLRIEPVPGASAVVAALSAAGTNGSAFTFLGFPPTRVKDRTHWLERLRLGRAEADVVFFEAPHRVLQTLEELDDLVNDQIIVFRELTKLHETVYRGTPAEVRRQLPTVAGEFTIVVPKASKADEHGERPSDDEIARMFGQITDKRAREAARDVADQTGLSPNQVYDIVRRANR